MKKTALIFPKRSRWKEENWSSKQMRIQELPYVKKIAKIVYLQKSVMKGGVMGKVFRSVSTNGRVTVPSVVRNALEIRSSDILSFEITDGAVFCRLKSQTELLPSEKKNLTVTVKMRCSPLSRNTAVFPKRNRGKSLLNYRLSGRKKKQ